MSRLFVLRACSLFVAASTSSCFVSESECVQRGVTVEPCLVSARAGQTIVLTAAVVSAPDEPVDWILPASAMDAFEVEMLPNRLTLISKQNVPAIFPIQASSQVDTQLYGGSAIGIRSASFGSQAPPFVLFGGDFPVGSKAAATAAGGNLYYVAYADAGNMLVGGPLNFFVQQYSIATNELLATVSGQFLLFTGTQGGSPIVPNVAADCAGNGYWVDSPTQGAYVLRRLGTGASVPDEQSLPGFFGFNVNSLAVTCTGAIYFVASSGSLGTIWRIGGFGGTPEPVSVAPSVKIMAIGSMVADVQGRLVFGLLAPGGGPGAGRLLIDEAAPGKPVAIVDPSFECEVTSMVTDVATDAAGVVYLAVSEASDNAVGSSPSSVASSDLDADGDVDLAVANLGDDTVSVLLNRGDGTFAAQVVYGVGFSPTCVTSIENLGGIQGIPSLVVACPGDKQLGTTIGTLINLGNGTFSPTFNTLTAGVGAVFVTGTRFEFGDDTCEDFATVDQSDNTVSVFSSTCGAIQTNPLTFGVGTNPDSATSADLDSNGGGDLAVTNSSDDTVSVLLNQNDGTYAPHVVYPVGNLPRSVASADFDGDTDTDLVVANVIDSTVSVLLNQGAGTFAAQVAYGVLPNPNSVTTADLDGDGDTDVATANYVDASISVLLNRGDGTFDAQVRYDVRSSALSLTSADFDGDDDVDLAVTKESNEVSVLFNRGDGTFVAELKSVAAVNELGSRVYSIGSYDNFCPSMCTDERCGTAVTFTSIVSLTASPSGALRIVDDVDTTTLAPECQESLRFILIDPR